ncbi:hypothetical protein KAW64_11530, partial [bacterium]|nr:hypothetical protein [bacterium]
MAALCALAVCAGSVGAEWQSFDAEDGLVANTVYAILEDGSGDLWFGTWIGVSRYDGV